MPTLITKTIGSGKDYGSIGAFLGWLGSYKLIDNNVTVEAIVYENQSIGGLYLGAGNADETHRCLFKPAPGMGVNDLESTLGYGTQGIQITIGSSLNLYNGMTFEGFRIDCAATTTINGKVNNLQAVQFRKNRLKTGASMTAFSGFGWFYDNLIIQGQGSTFHDIHFDGPGQHDRNTFVLASGATSASAIVPSQYGASIINNCSFVEGVVPFARATGSIQGGNNFSKTAPAAAISSSVLTVAGTAFTGGSSDPIPSAGGALIAAAGTSAQHTYDIRGFYRGAAPDVGAVQRTAQAVPAPPDFVVVTTTLVDQKVIVEGTYSGVTTSASLALVPASSNSNGATAVSGVEVVLTNGSFKATVLNAVPGNYAAPVVTGVGPGGSKASTTGNAFTVAPIAIPTGTAVSQVLNYRKLTITGTTTGTPVSGLLKITGKDANNNPLTVADTAVTLTDRAFTVTIDRLPFGTFDKPVVSLTNAAGTGTTANINTFVIQDPGKPVVKATFQKLLYRGLVVQGSIFTALGAEAFSGTITLNPAAGNTNPAQTADIRMWQNQRRFEATLMNVPIGEWQAPIITATNDSGTSVAATGVTPVSIVNRASSFANGDTITTVAITNDASSTAAYLPQTFGVAFVRGDLQSGKYLTATDNLGNDVPVQFDQPSVWEDGSIRFAVASVILSNVAAAETRTINLKLSSSTPATTTKPDPSTQFAGLKYAIKLSSIQVTRINLRTDLTQVYSYIAVTNGATYTVRVDGVDTNVVAQNTDAANLRDRIIDAFSAHTKVTAFRVAWDDPNVYFALKDGVTPAAFTLTVSTAASVVPTVSYVRDYFDNEDFEATVDLSAPSRTRLDGRAVKESVYITAFKRKSNGATHSQLRARSYIRMYANGPAWIDSVFDNTFSHASDAGN